MSGRDTHRARSHRSYQNKQSELGGFVQQTARRSENLKSKSKIEKMFGNASNKFHGSASKKVSQEG